MVLCRKYIYSKFRGLEKIILSLYESIQNNSLSGEDVLYQKKNFPNNSAFQQWIKMPCPKKWIQKKVLSIYSTLFFLQWNSKHSEETHNNCGRVYQCSLLMVKLHFGFSLNQNDYVTCFHQCNEWRYHF